MTKISRDISTVLVRELKRCLRVIKSSNYLNIPFRERNNKKRFHGTDKKLEMKK